MSTIARNKPLTHYDMKQPTTASIWHALSGSPVSDKLLEWPPDLFALTKVVLARSDAYRFALPLPGGMERPTDRFPSWSDAVEEAGRQWSLAVENDREALPDLLIQEWSVFRQRAGEPIELLAEGATTGCVRHC